NFFQWLDENDPDAIFVATGDHGTQFSEGDNQLRERASVMTITRFPQHCSDQINSRVNSINLMRLSLACATGQKIDLVPNKTYFGTYEKTGSEAGKVKFVPLEKIEF
ncbi:MAG: hypothetical protein CMH28_10720, partial [Micavibrio sp.]|nr:hypothetical protein [Micavibrio sp.]